MDRRIVYLIHILFVAPLLMYSGYIGNNLSKKYNAGQEKLFVLLFTIGLTVILYHLYQYIMMFVL